MARFTPPLGGPYLTMRSVADRLDFHGTRKGELARRWCVQQGVLLYRRGGRDLVARQAEIDRALESSKAFVAKSLRGVA